MAATPRVRKAVLISRFIPPARAPDELQRYHTGNLNAYDTFYRSVLPEYPNLSTSELSARFGVIGSALFYNIANPVRSDALTFVALPAALKRPNFDDCAVLLHGSS